MTPHEFVHFVYPLYNQGFWLRLISFTGIVFKLASRWLSEAKGFQIRQWVINQNAGLAESTENAKLF